MVGRVIVPVSCQVPPCLPHQPVLGKCSYAVCVAMDDIGSSFSVCGISNGPTML